MDSCNHADEKVELSGRGAAVGMVMTAPPSGKSVADSSGRGLKRKLGCVESETCIGRKKMLENEYILGWEIGKGRFGFVRLCRSKVNGEKFACKTLSRNDEEMGVVHRDIKLESILITTS